MGFIGGSLPGYVVDLEEKKLLRLFLVFSVGNVARNRTSQPAFVPLLTHDERAHSAMLQLFTVVRPYLTPWSFLRPVYCCFQTVGDFGWFIPTQARRRYEFIGRWEEGGNLRVSLLPVQLILPHSMKHLRWCNWEDPSGGQSWTLL